MITVKEAMDSGREVAWTDEEIAQMVNTWTSEECMTVVQRVMSFPPDLRIRCLAGMALVIDCRPAWMGKPEGRCDACSRRAKLFMDNDG